jgi:steroid 5-alpha reductase family enzyme
MATVSLGNLPGKREVSYPVAAMIIFACGYLGAVVTALALVDSLSAMLTSFLMVGLAVIFYITIVFGIAEYLVKRLDIVDIAWGGGFIVAAITSFILGVHELGLNIQTLVTGLVIVWGLRLGYYILRRVTKHPEDKRYVELRKKWKGNVAINGYTRIFLTQGVLATIISIAVILVNFSDTQEIGMIALVGATVWGIGFLFESVGDAQLKKFLSNSKNKGQLMTKGLWRYTRHPNYFGEATMWWGIFIIALSVPYGWIGVVTPVVITFLLRFVSGVPMTEASFSKKKGWQAYKRQTNIFVPLLPQK